MDIVSLLVSSTALDFNILIEVVCDLVEKYSCIFQKYKIISGAGGGWGLIIGKSGDLETFASGLTTRANMEILYLALKDFTGRQICVYYIGKLNPLFGFSMYRLS